MSETTAKYGMIADAATLYEAWLMRQPARDLREMLDDPEIDEDSAKFIREWLGSPK